MWYLQSNNPEGSGLFFQNNKNALPKDNCNHSNIQVESRCYCKVSCEFNYFQDDYFLSIFLRHANGCVREGYVD